MELNQVLTIQIYLLKIISNSKRRLDISKCAFAGEPELAKNGRSRRITDIFELWEYKKAKFAES